MAIASSRTEGHAISGRQFQKTTKIRKPIMFNSHGRDDGNKNLFLIFKTFNGENIVQLAFRS